jgi:hypothetical protein
LDPALHWAEAESATRDVDAGFDVPVHPSLAGDLMERFARVEAMVADEETVVSEHASRRLEAAGEGANAAPVAKPLPRASADIRRAGAVYDISGVPHPFLAALAALVGAASLMGRRAKQA